MPNDPTAEDFANLSHSEIAGIANLLKQEAERYRTVGTALANLLERPALKRAFHNMAWHINLLAFGIAALSVEPPVTSSEHTVGTNGAPFFYLIRHPRCSR